MKYPTPTTVVLLATAALAACNSQSSNNEAAQAPAAENSSAMSADGSNPFADAEQKMNQSMMSAVGTDVGDNWAKKMIAHHQGAIDMSQVLLAQNPKPDVAQMARETIDKQQKDIDNIRKLLKNGAPDQKSADLYQPAMMDMQQKMEAAKGADVSETFMRKMLEHHKGAIAMSDIALQNGVSGALRTQIQNTRDDNQKDAKMVEAMLRGESMSHAMADSGAKSADQAKKEPAPADRAKATRSSAGEHAGHDMNSMDMNSMEMNHM
jgi:uncharacterized protein (DUF305 family)